MRTNEYILISPYSQKIYKKDYVCSTHPEISNAKDIICTLCGVQTKVRNTELDNAKNYPYWDDVVTLLRLTGEDVLQIGLIGEKKIEGVSDFLTNIPFKAIEQLVLNSKMFISIDNFLPHLAHHIGFKRGIVLWGPSDPGIFGYKEFANLSKDRKYLRPDQFSAWDKCTFIKEAFVEPEVVGQMVQQIKRGL